MTRFTVGDQGPKTAMNEVSWGRSHVVQAFDPPTPTAQPPRFVNVQTHQTRVWLLRFNVLATLDPADVITATLIVTEGMGSNAFVSPLTIALNTPFPLLPVFVAGQSIFVDIELTIGTIAAPEPRPLTLNAWVAPFSYPHFPGDARFPGLARQQRGPAGYYPGEGD